MTHDLGVSSAQRIQNGSSWNHVSYLLSITVPFANNNVNAPCRDSKLTMLLRESLGNINCRTTMIAHISDSPANYADSLTTIQLASRIHRMRKKKTKVP